MSQRGRDFADCWRGEVVGALPTSVWVHAGPVAHVGLGGVDTFERGSGSISGGLRYNIPQRNYRNKQESHVIVLHHVRQYGMERGKEETTHRCFGILPGVLHQHGQDRTLLHMFDVDVGVTPLFVGVNVGFSPGEFLDFLLGWFGIDIAGDDTEDGRKERRFYREPPGEREEGAGSKPSETEEGPP